MGRGHPDADWIRSVVERFDSRLVSYSYRLTGDLESARDVVQETFLKLCDQRRVEVESHIAQWLYTVCRYQSLNLRRKERRNESLNEEQSGQLVSGELTADSRMQREEDLTEVDTAIATLPPNQREVVRLKFEHELSYREISAITGLTSSNVGYLLVQGLRELRKKLSHEAFCASHQ